MQDISVLVSIIRDFINRRRTLHILTQVRPDWNRLTSSLDVIGDTEMAFDAYLERLHDPATCGELYILLYGVMQALFIQQDAVENMMEALGLKYTLHPTLRDIREARNDSTGHPTKREARKNRAQTSAFISRGTMSRSGFTLMTTYPDRNPTFHNVNVVKLIHDQRDILPAFLQQVIEKLRKEKMDHRAEFKDEKLKRIFPDTLGYFYQKIAESIDGGVPGALGTMHLDYITEMIQKFQQALDKRGLLQAHNMDDLDIVEYPIAELRKYFETPTESKLNAKDANIFLAFIRSQTDSLITFAKEIDEDYSESMEDPTA
jgi:ribonucleotide reductase beta subunit family protein with ferritin-like domain